MPHGPITSLPSSLALGVQLTGSGAVNHALFKFDSGYGGITVAMMPNGPIYYYFSDNEEFVWAYAMEEANKLQPTSPSHLSRVDSQ